MEIAVSNLIIDGLVERITQKLQTEPEDLKVRVIRAGKLQDDPTQGYNILVHDGSDESHTMLAAETSNGRLGAIPHTIGGGSHYKSLYRLQLIFHFTGERNRIVARTKALVLLSRLKHAITTMSMPKHPVTGMPKDDFGETIIANEIHSHRMNESGGEGQFIWKGDLEVMFLTEYLPV